jgi:hypothetical protein
MTRERAKKLKEVFNAYADGQIIQSYSEHYGKWIDLAEVNFCDDTEYRVKPFQNKTQNKKWCDNYEDYQNACIHTETYTTANGMIAIAR